MIKYSMLNDYSGYLLSGELDSRDHFSHNKLTHCKHAGD